ncbi:hypothetical protein BaRGS_00027345, partial [Batillaria attramentaria]
LKKLQQNGVTVRPMNGNDWMTVANYLNQNQFTYTDSGREREDAVFHKDFERVMNSGGGLKKLQQNGVTVRPMNGNDWMTVAIHLNQNQFTYTDSGREREDAVFHKDFERVMNSGGGTTRQPRPGEVNGVDYNFLTLEEFAVLEKSGELLESGIFDGNHYGTPKPPKEPAGALVRRSNSTGLPGGQAKLGGGGQRKRTQSGSEVPTDSFEDEYVQPFTRKKSLERAHSSSNLGPLPPNWEMAYTEDSQPYFIDHVTETTHWLDPRLAHLQKQGGEECDDDVSGDGMDGAFKLRVTSQPVEDDDVTDVDVHR